MVGQILFIQGGGENTHADWDLKLVDSLQRNLGSGCDIRYPRMPDEEDPHYAPWKAAIRHEIDRLDDGAVLIGHSLGAAILIHTLAETPPRRRVGGIILLSTPFIGEGGWPSDEIAPDLEIGARLPPATPVHLFQGEADQTVPVVHADLYGKALPQAVIHRLSGRDHQLGNDLSEVASVIRGLGSGF